MIQLQEIDFPADCIINTHDFYDYDPEQSFNVENSLTYLKEDLLECAFPNENLVIDLGWYGNAVTNEGEFKFQIIQALNWEVPVQVIYSKSVDEIKSVLEKTLLYFTNTISEDEDLDEI